MTNLEKAYFDKFTLERLKAFRIKGGTTMVEETFHAALGCVNGFVWDNNSCACRIEHDGVCRGINCGHFIQK